MDGELLSLEVVGVMGTGLGGALISVLITVAETFFSGESIIMIRVLRGS